MPANGPFLGKECHFHFVLLTFLVLESLYFYDPLLLSHISLNLWTQNLWAPSLSSPNSEAESWLTRVRCLEMNFPWPQKWICFSKNTRFLLLPRDANPDPEPGQDPILSTWDVTQECSCSKGFMTSPELQSLMLTLNISSANPSRC